MKSSAVVVGLALSATVLFSATTSQALDRRVKIINKTSTNMTEFYASNAGTEDWQENIFGGKVLGKGKSVVINIDDGSGYCKFDFKAVFSDGEAVIQENNNVCELEEFTFRE